MAAVASPTPALLPLAGRTAIVHTITYMLMGVLASFLLDYAATCSRPERMASLLNFRYS